MLITTLPACADERSFQTLGDGRGILQDKHVAAQDIVNIDPLLRQDINEWQVAAADELVVELGADEQRVLGTELRQFRSGRGLAGGLQLVDDNHLALGGLGGQRGTQVELADLLGKRVAVVTDNRTMDNPPPRNWTTDAAPCRARPVPFWRYILAVVRVISPRLFTLWVPARRLASCQLTTRATISERGVIANTLSDSVMSPAALLSSVVTLTFIVLTLVCSGVFGRRLFSACLLGDSFLRRRLVGGSLFGRRLVSRYRVSGGIRHQAGRERRPQEAPPSRRR